MEPLKGLVILLGLAFTGLGYFIYFKKSYNLINGFQEAFKAGRKTEQYAKKVGLIEFILGVLLLLIGVCLILFS